MQIPSGDRPRLPNVRGTDVNPYGPSLQPPTFLRPGARQSCLDTFSFVLGLRCLLSEAPQR
jgi:hypothetical protein